MQLVVGFVKNILILAAAAAIDCTCAAAVLRLMSDDLRVLVD